MGDWQVSEDGSTLTFTAEGGTYLFSLPGGGVIQSP